MYEENDMNDEMRKFEILKMYLRAITDMIEYDGEKRRIALHIMSELEDEVTIIIDEPTEGF